MRTSFARLCGAMLAVFSAASAFAQAGGLQVEQTGETPNIKATILSPGIYKAVVWQASGGGINEFYDLRADPEAKVNLADAGRGLFEIGWHGWVPAAEEGKTVGSCGDWPSVGHKALKAQGELELIEKSPARVRVRAKSFFTFWEKEVHKHLPVECAFTFYPSARVVAQVRVRNTGDRPFSWTTEYGPHIMVQSRKNPELAPKGHPGLDSFASPKVAETAKLSGTPSEELVMVFDSRAIKSRFFITIPPEEHALFSRHMTHIGNPGGWLAWARGGYGSSGVKMTPGYDSTWACMIQMGTAGSTLVPEWKSATEGLPFALDYREPAKITGATPVTDDAGDFNKDGFNESEGCFVLKGPGPLTFTFEKGRGAGFAPVFKVLGWAGDAPRSVKIDGRDVPVAAGVVGGNLIVQFLGTVAADRARIEIGR